METVDLIGAQKNIKSISVTLEKRIKEIKEAIKNIDLKPASNPGNRQAVRPEKKNDHKDKVMKLNTSAGAMFGNFLKREID